jgi:hypothetical protein
VGEIPAGDAKNYNLFLQCTVENKAFRLSELFFLLLVLPPSRLPDMTVPDFYPTSKKCISY